MPEGLLRVMHQVDKWRRLRRKRAYRGRSRACETLVLFWGVRDRAGRGDKRSRNKQPSMFDFSHVDREGE